MATGNSKLKSRRRKIICLAGPTGSGKSGIAARLGRGLGGVVINADSRQVYADFPIITAQPGAEERAACPHLLYGFLDSREAMSAGRYARLARPLLEETLSRGETPILTGGTGLYFRALLRGLAEIPPVPEEVHQAWRARCAEAGPAALYRELAERDADYARKIHPHDRQRITRALEVWESTGRTLSWWHRNQPEQGPWEAVFLGLEISLAELEPLLARRIDSMLEKGALGEARQALERCADPDAPGWSGIGCAELHRAASGRLSLEEARGLWLKHTRAYAKRQLTWFRAEKNLLRRRSEHFAALDWLEAMLE